MLRGKKILLGVCGSIAAYKSALLVRLLIKSGAEVKVIMTSSALDFITPLTLSTLSKNPVLSSFTTSNDGTWSNHVDLGLWADLLVVAPASANTIGKMAQGLCDNLLLATYLSAKCPVMIAPAMDLDMYLHKSTRLNLERLKSFGNLILTPDNGELASGLVGEGRMQEPENIVLEIEHFFNKGELAEKKVLITAGPTYEAIDPVRFIGNHSSGKMGYALAQEAAENGAQVILVSGPTHQNIDHSNVEVINVTSAQEMLRTSLEHYTNADITILSAAVADYKPVERADQKIKKSGESMNLKLSKTDDIALELGKKKSKHQINIGFALETENEESNALKKLESKNLDFIVLNSLNDQGAGFGHDTNKITILHKNNNRVDFELKSKLEVAKDIIKEVINVSKK